MTAQIICKPHHRPVDNRESRIDEVSLECHNSAIKILSNWMKQFFIVSCEFVYYRNIDVSCYGS
jgi:hypothetical protein